MGSSPGQAAGHRRVVERLHDHGYSKSGKHYLITKSATGRALTVGR